MSNPYFRFKQFTIYQGGSAMKVTTDSCLFGAWVADVLQQENAPGHLLDIGAGTGLLSLMVAQKNNGFMDAVEIDSGAALQAQENINDSPWKDRIRLIHTSIQNFSAGKKYDHIFCNPPFYEKELKPDDHGRHVAHHSKELMLTEVMKAIEEHLAATGSFFLLLPAFRAEEAERLLQKHPFHLYKKILVRQTENHAPFRVLLRGGSPPGTMQEAEMCIMVNGQYSKAFTHLLKDYYLAL